MKLHHLSKNILLNIARFIASINFIAYLCLVLLTTNVYAAEVPASVYNRYLNLSKSLSHIIDKQETQEKSESQQKLIKSIILFYQKQSSHSLARQLLASNLYLQVLLSQQEYQQSYQVVDKLLNLPLNKQSKHPLDIQQQLTFNQLAGQLAAQFKTSKDSQEKAWPLVTKHFIQWFSLLTNLNEKQKKEYKITNKQQAANAALLAQAFYSQNKLSSALPSANNAYNLFPKNEAYLKLLLALLQGLDKQQELNKYLKIAVTEHPKNGDYWLRLAYNYLSLNQNESALSTLAITRTQGLLNTQGYKILGSLYLQQQQPRLAAIVYKEGVENNQLKKDQDYFDGLLNAWLMARDREQALAVLKEAKKAGYQSLKQDQQQAQLLYLQGRWPEAESAYKALLKSSINDTVNTQNSTKPKQKNESLLNKDKWTFLLAMSQIEQNKKTQAKTNLLKLKSKQYKKYAKEWLLQLE